MKITDFSILLRPWKGCEHAILSIFVTNNLTVPSSNHKSMLVLGKLDLLGRLPKVLFWSSILSSVSIWVMMTITPNGWLVVRPPGNTRSLPSTLHRPNALKNACHKLKRVNFLAVVFRNARERFLHLNDFFRVWCVKARVWSNCIQVSSCLVTGNFLTFDSS